MRNIKKNLFLILLLNLFFSASAFATTLLNNDVEIKIIKATQKNNMIQIELRFESLVNGYSGTTTYTDPSPEQWQNDFYLLIDNQPFLLAKNNQDEYLAPNTLALTFCYDILKKARVGSWKATFTAPSIKVSTATLVIPNITIKDIPIK